MEILKKINEGLVTSMKSKEEGSDLRTSTLRMMKSSIKNAEIAKARKGRAYGGRYFRRAFYNGQAAQGICRTVFKGKQEVSENEDSDRFLGIKDFSLVRDSFEKIAELFLFQ